MSAFGALFAILAVLYVEGGTVDVGRAEARPFSDRRQNDGCSAVSRPSKNNRQEPHEALKPTDSEIGPSDLPEATPHRPVSVTEGVSLRDEAVIVRTKSGHRVPVEHANADQIEEGDVMARPWYAVVSEWREWLNSPIYQAGHIEFENGLGEIGRARIENSYMESYSARYYARLKDLERGVRRRFGKDNITTIMLTLSATNQNAAGGFRSPGDHMREIADGWDTARKQLPHILEGYRSVYARVWEPHQSGYGHQHIAVFVEDPDGEIAAEQFRPFMDSYTSNVDGAGSEAHSNRACAEHDHGGGWNDAVGGCDDCRSAVSVNHDVENIGSYISEYLGIFGDEPLDRPITEQMFYATCWATKTRRLDFSNDAQDIISGEQFRRETGLRPEDRGQCQNDDSGEREATGATVDPENQEVIQPGEEIDATDPADDWSVRALCAVPSRTPEYSDPVSGGVGSTEIDGLSGVDPPKWVE